MSLTTTIVSFVVGIAAGVILGKMFKKEELSVESAISLLRDKGYYTKINVLPEGAKK